MGLRQAVPGDGAGRQQEEVSTTAPMKTAPSGAFFMGVGNVGA
jgi:hypothetical protein